MNTLLKVTFVVAVIAFPFPENAQSSDPLFGTRKLDFSKSKFSGTPPYRSLTVTMKPEKDGCLMISDTVGLDGQAHHNETFVIFDGKEHPLGANGNATISFLKVDDNTYVRVDRVNGQVVSASKITVSDGGRTHTMAESGKGRNGQALNEVLVFTE